MEIATARLRLDGLRAADAAALFAYRAHPAVSRFQGWRPASVGDAAAFIDAQARVAVDTPGTWWQRAIRLRRTDELIGDLGLHFMDAATVELGISIAPSHQRSGYASEAIEVVLDFVFGGLHKQRVVASVDPRNAPCMKLLERIGLRREPPPAPAHARDVRFAMVAEQWLAPERPDT